MALQAIEGAVSTQPALPSVRTPTFIKKLAPNDMFLILLTSQVWGDPGLRIHSNVGEWMVEHIMRRLKDRAECDI